MKSYEKNYNVGYQRNFKEKFMKAIKDNTNLTFDFLGNPML
jgi:hypothetical protein